ncbi:hypothetical protein [Pseudomonas sp. R37(2017)]|uniref:hypothetical protein n=1 Tax=Pseudomonas sp. R37(2017) TaxID=1981685 RepID=UPI00117B2235|nr:hypothetical protein [Pseudomonas sp. R37(2017)]
MSDDTKTKLDYFTAGFTKAFARRSKEQLPKQHTKTDVDVITSANTINTGKVTTITNIKLTDEQYRMTIVELMVNRIRQKKGK